MSSLAPSRPAEVTPLRAPRSVRRTSTIDTLWPTGQFEEMQLTGRARDIFTPMGGGAPVVRAEDGFVATLGMDRTIRAIASTPPRAAMPLLVGERGGGHLRKVLAQVMPEELHGATPLYLLLDDISGASLVAGWAWSQWMEDWLVQRNATMDAAALADAYASRVGICVGFAPGSSSLTTDPERRVTGGTPVPDLRNPADPEGWHDFADQSGAVGMRRARRIDVTIGDRLEVSAAFQDSASSREGGRRGLHEYLLSATADPATMRLTSLTADPRILPFPECPSAVTNLAQLVGATFGELRQLVLERLRGTDGCTHLNDAVRALAEVPALVTYLKEQVWGNVAAV